MVKMNTVQDELNQIAHAEADEKREREDARWLAQDDFRQELLRIEEENFLWFLGLA